MNLDRRLTVNTDRIMQQVPAPGNIAHFAINADNVDRACRFYEAVFGWKYSAYGPPGFFMIQMPPAGEGSMQRASIQGRREIVEGVPMRGLECTIAVSDIHATAKAIESNGGKIVMSICTLVGIGHLLFFEDTEGNIAGAMQYESKAE